MPSIYSIADRAVTGELVSPKELRALGEAVLARLPGQEAALSELKLQAAAAKEEAGFGSWIVGHGHDCHAVFNKAGQVTGHDDSPRSLIEANPNFPFRATLAYIASVAPDTILALIDRTCAAEKRVQKIDAYRDTLAELLADAEERLERIRSGVDDPAAWEADVAALRAALGEEGPIHTPEQLGPHPFAGFESECGRCREGSQHYLHTDRDRSDVSALKQAQGEIDQ